MRIASPRTCTLFTRSLPILLSIALLSALTGCGIGDLDTSSPQTAQAAPAFQGTMFGGQTPIVHATLKIYATGSDGSCTSSGSAVGCIAGDTGYGVATLLQEASVVTGGSAGQETDASGNFSFAGGYFCPAGEFAYIVGSGGSPGNAANAANSKILLVAALGRCEDLYTAVTNGYSGYKGSNIFVNEITTVAAGYALGNFATVSGSTVSIGAPATNNAAQISGSSTGTTTAAAGLYHAFLNAANLANPFSTTTLSSAPANPPSNSKATLPTALINTIANILANCVDSTGTGGQCSGLPGGADTFTAVKTLAANPTLSGSSTAVTTLYNLPTGTAQFSPTLSAAPNDYSIAINYPAGTGNGNGINLKFPLSIALDVNDNLYIANNSKYAGGTTGNAASNIISLASNGAVNAQTATIGLIGADYSLSLDASTPTSNGYFGDSSYTTTYAIGRFTFSSTTGIPSDILTGTAGSAAPHVYATAVDKLNNVWVWGSDGLFKSAAGGTAFNSANLASVTATVPSDNYIGLAIDPGQNVWMTASSAIAVYPAGASSTGATITATAPGNPSTGISFTGAAGASTVYVSSYSTSPGLAYFVPTYSSNAVTALNLTTTGSQGLQTYGGKLAGSLFNAVDSASNLWMADFSSNSLVERPGGTGSTAYVFQPCNSTVACTSLFATTNYGPVNVVVDSTGSLWVSTNTFNSLATSGGSLVQIIGSAAPTWPLLALGKYGVSP
jgi:hypothetical protein